VYRERDETGNRAPASPRRLTASLLPKAAVAICTHLRLEISESDVLAVRQLDQILTKEKKKKK
jgi:hypothetical protein